MAEGSGALPPTKADDQAPSEAPEAPLPTEAGAAELERQTEEVAARVKELATRLGAGGNTIAAHLLETELAEAKGRLARLSRAAVAARARLDSHQAAKAEAATLAMVEANKEMASASREAARASAQAALWAKWAAIFTAVAAAVSAYQAFKTGH